MSSARTVRPLLSAAIFTCALYLVHRLLQLQYYRHCKADLIRVVLFNQSVMCTHIDNILKVVEVAYHQVVKQATSHILASLGATGHGVHGDLLTSLNDLLFQQIPAAAAAAGR